MQLSKVFQTLNVLHLVQKDDEWVIQTTGSNIAKVLKLKALTKQMFEQTMSLRLQEHLN